MKTAKPRLKTLKPKVKTIDTRSAKTATVASMVRWNTMSGGAWQALRLRILQRDNGVCQCAECKRTNALKLAHEVDHVVPLWAGGTNDESNLQSIALDCHRAKSAREAAARTGGGLKV